MAFVPIGTFDGSDFHGKLREVEIASGVANTFLGDMLTLDGTASSDGRAEGAALATGGDADAVTATGTTNLAGAATGFTPDFTDEGSLTRNYHLTGSAQRAQIASGVDVVYEAPAITALAITDVGANRNIHVGAGGSTVTGISTHGIGAAPSTANEGQLRILGSTFAERAGAVAITAATAIWRCRINGSVDQLLRVGA